LRAEAENAVLKERLAETETRLAELTEQVAVLSRMLFGRSSEKTPAGPPAPAGGDGQPPSPAGAGRPRPKRGQRPGSKGHGRRDHSGLRTREEIHDVPADQRTCQWCGRAFERLGSECGERIDWRVEITRIVHRRLRYRRRCDCPGPRTVIAPPAGAPIRKGRFTSEFLARLLYHKYVLGLPVHRIAVALAAEGLDVAEGTLTGALKALAGLLGPLSEAITARNAAAGHVHADETSWRVYEKTENGGGPRWWLWVFISDDTVVFRMDPTRSATVLHTHFGIDGDDTSLPDGRHLVLSTDFYVAYQSLARVEGVDSLWCWAHIRRYFIRAGDGDPQLRYRRDQWVARIADLYLAHRAMAAASPGTGEHTEARAAFDGALNVIDTVRREQMRSPGLRPAGKKVLATPGREWEGLVRHRDFPDLDLDNNRSERALRGPVVGRKNYYGSHAEWSAHLAASVWTITATAERNHRDPLACLTDYLDTCAANGGRPPNGETLHRLLPWEHDPDGTTGGQDAVPPKITDTS
jgi:transposase